jgi:hypothetical protein
MIAIEDKIDVLVGNIKNLNNVRPTKPFFKDAIHFLGELSKEILLDKDAKQFPDVISFGFWCRNSNIINISEEYQNFNNRLGLGLIFHITPTNVPVNFAFSYAFSILAGNSNVVRVPSNNFEQVKIICRIINKILLQNIYADILEKTLFIRYSQDEEVTSFISSKCNARIVWGGDNTVNSIRKIPIPTRSIDIAFSDRYSFSIIDPMSISNLSELELNRLADNFYNDTYLMDQNACSSPHIIVWKSPKNNYSVENQKKRFWNAIRALAEKKYDLKPVNVIDKFTMICNDAINESFFTSPDLQSNYLYHINIENVPNKLTSLNGKFGYFYELSIVDLKELSNTIETKIQTITYFGVPKNEILDFIIEERLIGVDRIVPIGKALDIGINWDGHDLIRTLSRIIFVN